MQEAGVTNRNNQLTQEENGNNTNFHMNGFRCFHINDKPENFLRSKIDENNTSSGGASHQIHYLYLNPMDNPPADQLSSSSDKLIINCKKINTKLIKLANYLIPKGGLICLNYTNPEVETLLTKDLNYRQIAKNSHNSTLYIKL
jgi:hypothetical protein